MTVTPRGDGPHRTSSRRGSALIATLILVVLLSAATAAAARGARDTGRLVANQQAQVVARAMAESGVLAARARMELALRMATDSLQRLAVFDAVAREGSDTPFVSDSLDHGAFAASVVNVSARLDVNTAGAEGLARLFRTVAAPSDADRLAARIADRVEGGGANSTTRAQAAERQSRDSLVAALLGRERVTSVMLPFTSLDEVADFAGSEAPWLAELAPLLTVDGDGRVDRRHARPEVLASASGSLVDAPTRLLIIARGWMSGHPLTREIQAVYAIEQQELRLVTWRERDR